MTRFKPFISTILICAVFPCIFLVSEHFYTRIDLTQDKLYTLNPATIQILEGLEKKVRLEMYFSEKLPVRFQPVFDFVKALTEEYDAYGGDRFEVVFIDPKARIEAVDAAHKLGIYEVKANVTEKSRVEMTYIWFGLAMFCEDKKEVFPSVASIENFEYDLTAALLRLTREKDPEIALVGPTYEGQSKTLFDINAHMKGVYKELSQLSHVYQTRIQPETELNLHSADLVFAWGVHQYSESQLYDLDQYLMSGRPLILLASGVRTDPLTLKASLVPQGKADAFFAHFGIEVQRNLVCDQRCAQVKYSQTRPPVLKDYPLFPLVKDDGLSNKKPLGALNSLVIPWPSIIKTAPVSGLKSEVLAKTSENAWLQKEAFELDPDLMPGPYSFNTYPLAVAVNGRNSSFFENPGSGSHLNSGQIQLQVWGSEHLLTQTQNSSIPAWIAKTAGYLVLGSKLEGVNRKENAFRPIRDLSYSEKTRIKWLSVTVAPLLIMVLAGIRQLIRKRRNVAPLLIED